MITDYQLQEAHKLIRCVIQVIFQYEDSFKKEVLGKHGWNHDEYEIERCHMAEAFRITLKHEDFREKDLYVNCNVMYDWFMSNQKKVLGENE